MLTKQPECCIYSYFFSNFFLVIFKHLFKSMKKFEKEKNLTYGLDSGTYTNFITSTKTVKLGPYVPLYICQSFCSLLLMYLYSSVRLFLCISVCFSVCSSFRVLIYLFFHLSTCWNYYTDRGGLFKMSEFS